MIAAYWGTIVVAAAAVEPWTWLDMLVAIGTTFAIVVVLAAFGFWIVDLVQRAAREAASEEREQAAESPPSASRASDVDDDPGDVSDFGRRDPRGLPSELIRRRL